MPSKSRKSSRSTSSSSSRSSSLLKQGHLARSEQKHRHDHRRDRKMINLLTTSHNALVTTDRKNTMNSSIHVSKRSLSNETDDKDQVQAMDMYDNEVVDLCTPVNETAPVSDMTNDLSHMSVAKCTTTTTTTTINNNSTVTATSNQTCYKSRTLALHSKRHLLLPAFPASSENERPDLLLANVPIHALNEKECDRRRSMKYRPPFHVIGTSPTSILLNTRIPSFFWPIYQQLFGNISEHLHVDMSIIDYNYARLSKCIDLWAKECIYRFKKTPHEVTLDQDEYAIALEFYLQIDVDLFYMKTCSFRDVKPERPNKYLFCMNDPQARHTMTACGNCGLCYPKYDVKKRGQPSVQFGPAQRHQFVNKYEAILNCPSSCDISNIIYVLTCPCNKFDYIGESGYTLADRTQVHRYHGNRIMHECFIGKKNFKLTYPDVVKSNEHSTECPFAIQIFLNENPQYWRFIPFSNDEANQIEQNISISSRDVSSRDDIRTDEQVKVFIDNLPSPPPNYRFSQRQYHNQYSFFQTKRDQNTLPNMHLDLYNAKIIAVLPETGSKVLRRVIEALFITHAETKLNSCSHLVNCNNNPAAVHEKVVWCEGLVRRPLPIFITTTATNKTASKTR